MSFRAKRRNLFLLLVAVLAASCTRPDILTLFVGTYSDGFYAYDFDQRAGEFVGEGPVAKAEMPNPSYLAVRDSRVYAVSEVSAAGRYDVSLTATDGVSTGTYSLPACVLVRAEDIYVATDGTLLAVANYSGGTLATYRLREDGSIAPLDSLLVSGTGGPDLSRQADPHVHCAVFSPEGKHLFFSEFSADEIGRMDVYAGGVRGYCRAASLHADYGPRHLLFDASGKHLYVIGELSGDITVFDYADGALTEKQVIKADRMDARGAADIHFSPDGKFLYASLRLRGDGIVVFEVGPGGLLNYVGYTATGPHPRNFNITPNGRFVLVCCRDNDSVEIYERDAATGLLTFTGRRLTQTRPVYIGW